MVRFGDLPSGYTAFDRVWTWVQDGPNRVANSNIRLNQADHGRTTSVANFCRGRYGVESTMTHPRAGAHLRAWRGARGLSREPPDERRVERAVPDLRALLGGGEAMGLKSKY
jgi:hypothetical protein